VLCAQYTWRYYGHFIYCWTRANSTFHYSKTALTLALALAGPKRALLYTHVRNSARATTTYTHGQNPKKNRIKSSRCAHGRRSQLFATTSVFCCWPFTLSSPRPWATASKRREIFCALERRLFVYAVYSCNGGLLERANLFLGPLSGSTCHLISFGAWQESGVWLLLVEFRSDHPANQPCSIFIVFHTSTFDSLPFQCYRMKTNNKNRMSSFQKRVKKL